MGLDLTKSVFGVSTKGTFKPVSSASETSQNIEISLVASLDIYDTFQKANKGSDQSAGMHRLACAFVSCISRS